MRKFSEKIVKAIGEAKDLVEKIMRWRQMQLDEILHVRYEPNKKSAKSQFQAILADVNEDPQKIEEAMKLFEISEGLAGEVPLMDALYEMEITDEQRAEIEHKKKLKQQREMLLHHSRLKDKR